MKTTKTRKLPRVRVEVTTEPLTAARRHVWDKVWDRLLTSKPSPDKKADYE